MGNLFRLMETAYDSHRGRADALLQEHHLMFADEALEEFIHDTQHHFLLGVHEAFQKSILDSLDKKLGNRPAIADVFGLKDPSSISHMRRSGTIDGVRLTAALHQYPDIPLPSRERAAESGFARAAGFIKSVAYDDRHLIRALAPQDLSYIIGVLASNEWDAAISDPNPNAARRVAQEIIRERTIPDLAPEPLEKYQTRPEQLVLKLQRLQYGWADFVILSLWAIPERIPETLEA